MPVGHAESNDLLRNGERSSEFGVLALTRRYATKLEDLPLNTNLLEYYAFLEALDDLSQDNGTEQEFNITQNLLSSIVKVSEKELLENL